MVGEGRVGEWPLGKKIKNFAAGKQINKREMKQGKIALETG